jgi:hypothetical protein
MHPQKGSNILAVICVPTAFAKDNTDRPYWKRQKVGAFSHDSSLLFGSAPHSTQYTPAGGPPTLTSDSYQLKMWGPPAGHSFGAAVIPVPP